MRRGEEEQGTDIKSNNPHLAGGEQNFWFCASEDKVAADLRILDH